MRARWFWTDRTDGDFSSSVEATELVERCRSLVDAPWTLLDQVHRPDVVEVTVPGGCAGSTADAAVTTLSDAVLALRSADCAVVVLVGSDHRGAPAAVGIAHAGWAGLEAGVLQNTVAELRRLGAVDIDWHLGPCISAANYEFGREDLARLVERYGDSVASMTSAGAPALDLRAGVAAAMAECGASGAGTSPLCTAANDRYYSWRARHERGRQITAVWLENESRPVSGRAVRQAYGFPN